MRKEKKKTEVLDDYEYRPVPEEARYGWIQQSTVWIGVGFCLSAFSVGGVIAANMSIGNAFAAISIGALILTLIGCLIGGVGVKVHLSSSVTSRFTYGIVGAKIYGAIIAMSLIGWFGFQCSYFASSAVAVLGMMGITANNTVLGILGGLLMMITAIVGYKGIKMLSNIGVPLLFITMVAALILTFVKVPFSQMISNSLACSGMTVSSGIVTVVGSFVVGASIIPDFSRFSKTTKDSTIGCIIGYFIAYIMIVFSGSLFYYAFQESDIAVILIDKAGMGAVAAFVVIVSTWTTNDNNLYQGMLGIMNLLDGKVKLSRATLTAIIGVVATIVGAAGIVAHFTSFLSLLGILVPPIAAVTIGDYYIHNKADYDYAKMDSLPKFKTANCFSAILGAVFGLIANYSTGGFLSALTSVVPSSLVAMLIALICQFILQKAVVKKAVTA